MSFLTSFCCYKTYKAQSGGYEEEIFLPKITTLKMIVGQLTVCSVTVVRPVNRSRFICSCFPKPTGFLFHTAVNESRTLISRPQPWIFLFEMTTVSRFLSDLISISAVSMVD